MKLKIGFTGTRQGMSKAQLDQFEVLMRVLQSAGRVSSAPFEFHHGNADGADTQARYTAVVLFDFEDVPHEIKRGDSPLVRDREIANVCDILIAAPLTDKEELRSGTWATVRYARDAGKPVIMLSRGKSLSQTRIWKG